MSDCKHRHEWNPSNFCNKCGISTFDAVEELAERVVELTEAVDDAWQVIASDESQYLRNEWLKKWGNVNE